MGYYELNQRLTGIFVIWKTLFLGAIFYKYGNDKSTNCPNGPTVPVGVLAGNIQQAIVSHIVHSSWNIIEVKLIYS